MMLDCSLYSIKIKNCGFKTQLYKLFKKKLIYLSHVGLNSMISSPHYINGKHLFDFIFKLYFSLIINF